MAGEADIFVSYAQGDRDWVKELATALEAEGFSVWWDPNLLPGTKFRDTINKELTKARTVIVVWSRLSVDSDWVRDEAEDARQLNKLVPTLKDPITPPHGFRQLQTANLSQWRGRREHPEFRGLVEGIRALIAGASSGPDAPSAGGPAQDLPSPASKHLVSPAPQTFRRNWNGKILVGGIAALVVAALLGAYAAGRFALRPIVPQAAAKPEIAASTAAASPPPAMADSAALPRGIDLTGTWKTDGGATFYVRQIGSEIWWYGTQSPGGKGWTNVANGHFDGNSIQVHWVDIPPGSTRHSGSLTLTRADSNHLMVSQNPNDFVSDDWFRK